MGDPRCYCTPSTVCAPCFLDGGHTIPACWRGLDRAAPERKPTGPKSTAIALRDLAMQQRSDAPLVGSLTAGEVYDLCDAFLRYDPEPLLDESEAPRG